MWGASVLPFMDEEIADWPFAAKDIHDHYKKAAAILGIAGAPDGLSAKFPFYSPPSPPLNSSLQAQSVLARFNDNAASLKTQGFSFGRARHAVKSNA